VVFRSSLRQMFFFSLILLLSGFILLFFVFFIGLRINSLNYELLKEDDEETKNKFQLSGRKKPKNKSK